MLVLDKIVKWIDGATYQSLAVACRSEEDVDTFREELMAELRLLDRETWGTDGPRGGIEYVTCFKDTPEGNATIRVFVAGKTDSRAAASGCSKVLHFDGQSFLEIVV